MHNVLISLLLTAQLLPLARQTGTIQGRIADMDGTPASGVRVAAQPVPESGIEEDTFLAGIAQTDETGRFRLENLLPGRYYIAAGLVDLPTYYPGVSQVSDARIVTVTADSVVEDIQFSLARPAGLRVRGKVSFDPRVAPLPSVRVLIAGNGFQKATESAADLTFEFEGVPPGTYRVGLSPANGSLPQQIVLTDQDAQVEIRVPFRVTVTGSVTFPENLPQPRLPITFMEDGNPSNRLSTPGAPNNRYSVLLPPGTYQVTPAVPDGFAIDSLTSGSTDLLQAPLVVSSDGATEFAAVLKPLDTAVFAKVSGRVTGALRDALQVRLIPGGRGGSVGTLLAPVAADGTFEFPRVVPGNYAAVVDNEQVSLTVGTRDLTEITITLPERVEIPAHITVEGGGPVPRLSFALLDSSNRRRPVRARTQEEAVYVLEMPVGTNSLAITVFPSDYIVRSVMYGSVDLLTSPIEVSDSSAIHQIEVTVALAPGITPVTVSGRVLLGTEPFPGSVRLVLQGQPAFRNPIEASPGGVFEIPQVLPGTYTLRAAALGLRVVISTPVTVTRSGLTGLQVHMPAPLRDVSGRLTLEGAEDAGRPGFWFQLTGVNNSAVITTFSSWQPDGTFRVRMPPGEWKVSIDGLPSELNLKSATFGELDVLRNTLQVSEADSREFRLTLAPRN